MRSSRRGFALLTVIWGIGMISLFVISFMSSSRLQLQTAYSLARASQSAAIQAGVTNLAIIPLVREQRARASHLPVPAHDGTPSFCVFENAIVAIAIEDESGKVDLNAASQEMLTNIISRIRPSKTANPQRIAEAITEYRSPAAPDPGSSPATNQRRSVKADAFQTIMELDQVDGVDDDTFHALLPIVTVHSRSSGIDPRTTPPALFAALIGSPPFTVASLAATPFPNRLNRSDPRFPSDYRRAGVHTAFLVSVEASLDNEPSGARQTIVETPSNNSPAYAIREIRHGAPRYARRLQAIRQSGVVLPPC